MTAPRKEPFAELLKYWRARRGVSQLELSVLADVSARHISFLETGRSRPSKEMVSQLCFVLNLSMRNHNEVMVAAGFAPLFEDDSAQDALQGPLGDIVETILESNEPFPTMVLDRHYEILAANQAAVELFGKLGLASVEGLNLMRTVFMPGAEDVIGNWDQVAGDSLRRLHREVLYAPDDLELAALFDELRGHASLGDAWWCDGFDHAVEPVVPIVVVLPDGSQSTFLATTTTFNAPRNTALDDLVIETWYTAL